MLLAYRDSILIDRYSLTHVDLESVVQHISYITSLDMEQTPGIAGADNKSSIVGVSMSGRADA